MKVQRIKVKNKPYSLYVLIDNDYKIVDIVLKYVKFLDNTGKSPNTIKTYTHHLKLYFEYLNEINKNYKEVTFNELSNFIGWLRNPICKDNVRLLKEQDAIRSESTVNHIMSAIISFYSYVDRLEDIGISNSIQKDYNGPKKFKSFLYHTDKNKTLKSNVLKLKEKKKILRTLTIDEVKELVNSCNTLRDKLILMLMYEGGLRVGEVLGLRLEDVITWNNEINIKHRIDNENEVYAKSKTERVINVSKNLMKLYLDYIISEYDEEVESDYVFINTKGKNYGKPLRYHSVLDLFNRLENKTGIKVNPHALRHTHATDLLKSGWDAAYVQKRLGHANIQTTLDTYIHLTNNDMKLKYKDYISKRGDVCE
ncbi:transposase (plasmid) [Paraclostridium bifermentans]|uniref:Transposase n=1 Tax=Paraclostridium bifermentans TaxID=1490 RepID=A0A5P3XDA3_PARBF|nr:tyrosine-type recombinase/integrase [Paraclostridium bifermentans]QEZ68712.1 transposase [Paraclostridium bifermentans]QEZ70864.1 transposase [Paraclostridium bifermentans]